jgi:hypothetical protein
MKNFLFTILILLLLPLSAYAVESIPTSTLYAQSDVDQLDQIELQRQRALEQQVGFTLPQYTDNPSYVVTFVDPSPDKKGVEIQIDGKEFAAISSPYTFPALVIGEHNIKFRFNDKDGNVQTLEYTLIVIPRSPIINPPVIEEDSITLKGTGLSNSDILFFLTSNTFNHTETVQTDSNGEWSVVVKPEDGLSNGIYTATAYTRRYGYSSELAQPTVFEVGNSGGNINERNNKGISFAFKDIDWPNIINTVSLNPDLIILVVGTLLLGIIPTVILSNSGKRSKEEYFYKNAEKNIKGDKKGNEKTLRELFESKDEEVKEPPKEEKKEIRVNTDVSKNIKEGERIITKKDFLKEYKSVDPDESTGREKSSEKIKKEIKVSLTSREE